jgi:hypothetical protein
VNSDNERIHHPELALANSLFQAKPFLPQLTREEEQGLAMVWEMALAVVPVIGSGSGLGSELELT